MAGTIVRDQHAGFGKEFRVLSNSKIVADRELAGVLASEMDELVRCKERGARHPKEDRLEADLAEVGYLRLYPPGQSVRLYFVVRSGRLWMIHLDRAKRRDKILPGTRDLLKKRIRELPA